MQEPELKSMQLSKAPTRSTAAPAPAAAPLPFDATVLFEALHYQLLVAVEQCHGLNPDECLWLEAMGDVTVPGRSQTEVKHFHDELTDSHLNFWNTIKNWLHQDFNRSSFQTLVLLTSQEFGAHSSLKDWNTMTAVQRFAVIEKIAGQKPRAAKAPEDKTAIASSSVPCAVPVAGSTPPNRVLPAPSSPLGDKNTDEQAAGRKLSKARITQQYVMASEHRPALMEVLERMLVAHGQADLPERLKDYKTRHLKIIRLSLQQQYMDDLLGFMFSAGRVLGGWRITHGDFSAQLTALAQRYMKHPSEFPQVDKNPLEGRIDLDEVKAKLFATKILEIEGEKYLRDAALHLLVAEKAIGDLYRDQILFKPMLDGYLNSHRSIHLAERESAMLDCDEDADIKKLKKASLRFYLRRLKAWPAPFCSMNNTMAEFRNGIYHMLANETPEKKEEEFHWKMWL